MTDFFNLGASDGTGGDPALLAGPVAQFAARDPRRAYIAQMLAQSGKLQEQPTLSPFATLAKAIAGGIPGVMEARLQQEYADANKGYTDDLTKAMAAMRGTPAGTDENGQPTPAHAPDINAALDVLQKSPSIFARQQGTQMAFGLAQKQAEARLQTKQALQQKGFDLDDNNNIVKLGGEDITKQVAKSGKVGELQGEAQEQPNVITATTKPLAAQKGAVKEAETNAENKSNTQTYGPARAAQKGAEAGAERNAQNQSDLTYKPKIAGAETAAKAPIEAFMELFKPQVDRQTGEITIPGVARPDVVDATLKGMGLSRQDVQRRVLGDDWKPQGQAAPGATAPTPSTPVSPALPGAPPAKPPVPGAPGPSGPQTAPSAPAIPEVNAPGAPAQGAPGPVTPIAAPGPGAATGNQSQAAPAQAQQGAQAPARKGPVPVGTMKPIDEVPAVPLPTGLLPASPGTIVQGRDPIQIKAGERAVDEAAEQYKEIAERGQAATSVQAQLGTMRSLLDQGKLNTNLTGEVRKTLASLVYAASNGNRQLAMSMTGIDPASAEVFGKESFRLGAALARTLGAREAVQVVQQAIHANPSLLNTLEGNKQVIDLLSATAQHDIDAQKYQDAWFQKNHHYVGAQGWFNENHPVEEYTSKVIPYEGPRSPTGQIDPSKLRPNVTYRGRAGTGIWNGESFQ